MQTRTMAQIGLLLIMSLISITAALARQNYRGLEISVPNLSKPYHAAASYTTPFGYALRQPANSGGSVSLETP